jgi:mono/diheme cytochrome c family protein
MTKVGKGPQALQGSLGAALKQSEPAWDTIQPKTQEYAQLTSELGKLEPVKGTKDSWAKLTLAFADSAAEFEHAAQAKDKNKDKDKTKEALDSLGGSCMACHREHRVRGPGMGGPRREVEETDRPGADRAVLLPEDHPRILAVHLASD